MLNSHLAEYEFYLAVPSFKCEERLAEEMSVHMYG